MEELMMEETADRNTGVDVIGCLEIFSRTGRVVQRITLRDRDIRIGRGYDNDIIIDDPFVSPHHMRLQWRDGALFAEDLDSMNGTIIVDKGEKVRSFRADSGLRFRAGHTVMRFCGKDHPVAETLKSGTPSDILGYMENPLFSAFITLITAVYILTDISLGISGKNEEMMLVGGGIAAAAMITLWSSIWSLASRIVTHRWNLILHIGAASLGILMMSLFDDLASYFSFMLQMDDYIDIIRVTGYSSLFALLLYSHLRLVSPFSHSRMLGISLGASIMITGTFLIVSALNERNFNPSPAYTVTIKPPMFRFMKSQGTESFFDIGDDLLKRVNDLAGKPQPQPK